MASYRTLCRRCRRYALVGHAYRRWYRVARAVIRRLTVHRIAFVGPPSEAFHRLADLVAITSPRVSVKRNLRFAWGEFIGDERLSDMTRSTRSALDHYYRTGEIRGPKTNRFARVLRGDDNVVVVDTWTARALGVADGQARKKSTQELAERVMRHVQRSVSRRGIRCVPWTLAETQAAVWAGVIRTHYDKGKIPMYRTEDVGLYRTGTNGELSGVPFEGVDCETYNGFDSVPYKDQELHTTEASECATRPCTGKRCGAGPIRGVPAGYHRGRHSTAS